MLNWIKNLLNDHLEIIDEKEYKNKRKLAFLVFFTTLSVLFLLVYSFIHLSYDKKYFLAYSNIVIAGISILNLIFFAKAKYIEIGSIITLITFSMFFCLLAIDGGIKNLGILWIFTFPIFAYYFQGKIKGSICVILFFIFILIIACLDYFKVIETPYSFSKMIYILSVLLMITLMSFFYEDTTNRSEAIIKKQLYTNGITRLPNRTQLLKDIKNLKGSCLVLLNVDDFKTVNDLYGNKIGDLIIYEISLRLKPFLDIKYVHNIYRLHADEFAVLLNNIKSKKKIEELADSVHRSLTREFIINDLEIILNLSIGISRNHQELLAQADMALKLAKENRKDYVFFDKLMLIEKKYEDNLKWIKILKRAIAFDNVVPYFQPIVNNNNNKVEKYECLIRLIYNNEIISPHNFLDIAKKSKIYFHLTKIMALKAFESFKEKNYSFSINISVDDILNIDTVNFICKLIKEFSIGDRVVFEIIESERIVNSQEVLNFIAKVKNLGCKIAIDDFGTGYSNFDYTLKMNVDFIKLDASLIKNLDKDRSAKVITETIVNFTKKLGIKTIAEYVHSENIYKEVKNLGIDYSQGYYFGEPQASID